VATVVVAFPSTGGRIDPNNAGEAGVTTGWALLGGGKSLTAETDFKYQGSYSISVKVSKSQGGLSFSPTAGINFSATPRTALLKMYVATPGLLGSLNSGSGLNAEMGSGGVRSAWYVYYLEGVATYPRTRAFIIRAVDPNLAAFRDEITGSPTLTSVNYFGFEMDDFASASAKGQNMAVDSIDYVENGAASLLLTRGDSTDADGTFQHFVDWDFNTAANSYGVVIGERGVIFVTGKLGIGESATATEFTDSLFNIVFADGKFDSDFSGIIWDVSNASTVIVISDGSFLGRGSATIVRYFDTALDVATATEIITITGHGFSTADYVTYSKQGGSHAVGLTDTSSYFVNRISADTIYLYDTRANALVGGATGRLDLTVASAPGESHSLTRSPDTRPNFDWVGTTADAVTEDGIIYNNVKELTLSSAVTMTRNKFIQASKIFANVGTPSLANCTFSDSILDEGSNLILVADLAVLSGCTFVASDDGHAVKLASAAGTPFTWNHEHSGYWAPADNGWNFSTAQAFTSEQINFDANHGFTTGDAVFYNREGGSASIGLGTTDDVKYYVNVVDSDTVTVHATKTAAIAGSSAINLTTSGSETHSLYSGKATLWNNSGGSITVNVSGGVTFPSIRNGANSSTLVQSTVTLKVTVKDVGGNPIENAQTAIYLAASPYTQLMNEDTLSSGIAQEEVDIAASTAVSVRVRKGDTGFTKYIPVNSPQTTTATGLDITITLEVDTNNNS